MNPEFLPEFVMLIAGAFAVAIAFRLLAMRRPGRAMWLIAVGVALAALAVALGRSGRVHSPYGKAHLAATSSRR